MSNNSAIFTHLGIGFIGSLLASLIVYAFTRPDLDEIKKSIKEDLKENLVGLRTEVEKITEVLNRLTKKEEEGK